MRRREFITLLGSAAGAAPFASLAQQQPGRVPRIGFLVRTSADSLSPLLDSFRQSP